MSDVPAVVGELRAVLARVAALDPTDLADPGLFIGLGELFDAETVLRAAQTRWLAVADTRETTVAMAGRASRSWLIEECQLGGRDASARLRLARTLGVFPVVEEAFRTARLTADQAAAIVTGASDVPAELRAAVAEQLVARAGELTPFALSRATEALLVELDVESGKDRAEAARQRRLARRGVDLDATFEGTGSLAGTLAPEVHDAVKAALDAIDPPARSSEEDDRTPRQRRHDALGALARYYLDGAADLPAVNAERPRVVVTIAAGGLLDRYDGNAAVGWGRLDSGLPVSLDTAKRLGCDAQVLPVVIDTDGDVLRLGRATRIWSAGQRRAAWIRDDGRCAFPHCRRAPADLHHVDWWSRGGATNVDNAAWLCSFHHWLVHEAGWTMRRSVGRSYVFTSADGRQVGHEPVRPNHPPPRQLQPA